MIDIDDHPLAPVVLAELQYRLDMLAMVYPLSQTLRDKAAELIELLRVRCAARDIYFPPMVVFVLPSVNALQLVRKDLDRRGVETTVVNLCQQYPTVRMGDIAMAVFEAFPNYRPSRLQ